MSDKYGEIDKVGASAQRMSWVEEDARRAALEATGPVAPEGGEHVHDEGIRS